MAHHESVRILASLLRASNEARPVLLLGAGASFSSGVPLAGESVRRLARRVYAEKVKGGSLLPEHVKLTEWQNWLQSHPWYISGEDRLAENFPLAVQHLLVPREYRTKVLLDLLKATNGIGPGYERLAELVMRGLVRTILTTNFDSCLPAALHELRAHIPHIAEVNRGPDDLREFKIFGRAQVVWLHGKAEQYTDRNLEGEVEKLDAKLVKLLVPLLDASPLVAIGYRGAEPSIMESLLLRNARHTQNFRNGVYWCVRSGDALHPRVEALRDKLKGNFRQLDISGFDELMSDLARELRDEDLYPAVRAAQPGIRDVPFDDRPLADASLEELDSDLLLATMRDYCARLRRAPVRRDTLPALLREQGLLVCVDGKEVPTAGCVLLFGKNPQERFPHAVVSATITGKKRVLFSGNLIQQRRALLAWLNEPDINPLLRVKRRTTHEEKRGYAPRALTELLVNMLVHRDYEVAELSSIDVVPGSSISFRNPGGLLESVARSVVIDDSGQFRPVANVSDLRNRSLCDVFFGMQAMEREGTGLVDVETMARDAGGDASFAYDRAKRSFVAVIRQPVSSAGSRTVARDGRPTGVYVFNALRFAAMPDLVTVARLTMPLRDRPRDLSLDGLGTFVRRTVESGKDELWSFAPLKTLAVALAPIVDAEASSERTRASIEESAEDRKVLSWLLRKHLERHLEGFADAGLVIEDGRRRRAYFQGMDGKPRMLVYDTARRKGVARQVVKQRADDGRAWFENEGFGYEVTDFDGCWAVRIKPFYMFTGRDACTPLPAFTRTGRATRRMKLDRNKNVEDDLTFWARFLAAGQATINIGQEHVDELILDGGFTTVELAEEGLLDDRQNRMLA